MDAPILLKIGMNTEMVLAIQIKSIGWVNISQKEDDTHSTFKTNKLTQTIRTMTPQSIKDR